MNWPHDEKVLRSLQAARDLLAKADTSEPPVDLERAAAVIGATIDYTNLGSLDACLSPKRSSYTSPRPAKSLGKGNSMPLASRSYQAAVPR